VYHLKLRRRRHQLCTLSNSQAISLTFVCEYLTFVCLSCSVYCLESHMCNCWSRNTTSMAGGTSPGRHGVVCAGIGLVGESRQTRCSVAGIGLVSILCMCKESEYHKYGRRGEYRQTRCSVAGIVLARFMSGNKDRATETYVCVLFYARVP
jgi:hypothetical protein